jgi:hypothetical protein
MRAVPPKAVAAALLPAAVVVVLFFFDHGISALMARDVLRDQSRGDEKDEAATAETGAAAEEGAALEAGGRAPAKAAAAAAASPERAPTTTNLKPSAYAYDLFLCVRFLLWSERERERQRRETRKGERSTREKRNRNRRKNSLLLSTLATLHNRASPWSPPASWACPRQTASCLKPRCTRSRYR